MVGGWDGQRSDHKESKFAGPDYMSNWKQFLCDMAFMWSAQSCFWKEIPDRHLTVNVCIHLLLLFLRGKWGLYTSDEGSSKVSFHFL